MVDSSHVYCGESGGCAGQENLTAVFSDEASRLFLLNGIELSAIVFRGPDVPTCNALLAEGLPELRESSALALSGFDSVKSTLDAFMQVGNGQRLCETLESAYVRLFVSNKNGVPAPPYASFFLEGRMMGQAAIDMKERLEAAELAVGAAANEPPDHFSIMLEYVYYLLSTGWHEEQYARLAAAEALVREDILPWYSMFAKNIAEHDDTGFFSACAVFTYRLLLLLSPVGLSSGPSSIEHLTG